MFVIFKQKMPQTHTCSQYKKPRGENRGKVNEIFACARIKWKNVCLFRASVVQCLCMFNVIAALDEYFCAHYSDYVRLSALEGYIMPETLVLGADGNVQRRDPSCMRLCYQKECEKLLAQLKEGLVDTNFTFSFRFLTAGEKFTLRFRKHTFAKLLPAALSRCGETVEGAGKKLDIEPRFWNKMAKGSLIPEKNTVLALALTCRMNVADVNNLFAVCGFEFDEKNVNDVVVRYLLEQGVWAEELQEACFSEYKITNIPIRRES